MKVMSSAEVIAHLREKPDQVMFWCRSGPGEKWVLLPRVAERGIQYGMRHWEFFGPVLNPDQLAAREPMGWAVLRDGQVWSVRLLEPTGMSEAGDAVFVPLYP